MTAEHTSPFWGKEHPESGQPSEIPQAPKELERLIQARADKITSKLGKEKAEELLKKYNADGLFVDDSDHVWMTEGMKERFQLLKDTYSIGE